MPSCDQEMRERKASRELAMPIQCQEAQLNQDAILAIHSLGISISMGSLLASPDHAQMKTSRYFCLTVLHS